MEGARFLKLRNVKVAKRLGTKTLAGLLAFGLVVGTPSVVLADVQSTMSQSDAVQTEKLQAKSVDGRDTLTDVSDKVMDMIRIHRTLRAHRIHRTLRAHRIRRALQIRRIRQIHRIRRIHRVSQRRQVLRMFPVHRMLQENTRQQIINRRQIQLRKKMRQRVQKAIKNLLQSRRL